MLEKLPKSSPKTQALGKINIGSRRKGKEEVLSVFSGTSLLLTKYMEKEDIHVILPAPVFTSKVHSEAFQTPEQ